MTGDGGAEVTATTIKPCAHRSHLAVTATIHGRRKTDLRKNEKEGERDPRSSAKLLLVAGLSEGNRKEHGEQTEERSVTPEI